MTLIKQKYWDRHINIINEFHSDAFQQQITWKSCIKQYGTHGDDNEMRYKDITILGLIQYNHFRSWPINKDTIVGQVDQESELLFLNIKYLRDNGYTNDNDQFIFKPALDRFEVNGVVYTAKGDSQTAQAKDKVLLHFIVLKREEIETSENIY